VTTELTTETCQIPVICGVWLLWPDIRGDLDGRGNLSDEGLARFCRFLLGTAIDKLVPNRAFKFLNDSIIQLRFVPIR